MKLSVMQEPQCTVLVLEGRLDSNGAQEFEQLINSQGSDWNSCILDFQGVAFMSSLGIRVLIKLARAMKSRQGRLFLAALPDDVHWTLETTGLLSVFTVCSSRAEAIALAGVLGEEAGGADVEGFQLAHYPLHGQVQEMLYWQADAGPGFLEASLEEMPWALGRGRLGAESQERSGPAGYFLAIGNALIMAAPGHDSEPELALSRQPADLHIGVEQAISWSEAPNHLLRFNTAGIVQAGQLARIIMEALGAVEAGQPESAGFLVLARSASREEPGEAAATAGPDLLLAVWGQRPEASCQLPAEFLTGLMLRLKPGRLAAASTGSLNAATPGSSPEPARAWAELLGALREIDGVEGLGPLDAELPVRPMQAWCFVPERVMSGLEKRVVIEVGGGQSLPPAWELIARRLYSDASRVMLEPLTGGFSPAQPFRATAEDMQGRRMLPTVFKVGPEELVKREQEAHRQYVEKYILNNSTAIMGSYSSQGCRGICYNFVGIGGPESRLEWMGKVYRQKSAGEVIALFDRLFTSVLKPWYGQPRLKELHLYQEHVNAFGFFPDLFADARAVSGVPADEPELDCPWLGRRLPNPFHFLREQYPLRREQPRLWYEGICHGDLNLQNILLDEKENLYVIDFSETGLRNIVADFARLEPILKFETTRLENEADLGELIRFEEGLARAGSLDEQPPLQYDGSDPAVAKAYQVILRLRQYARQVVVFENDLVPYLLAILEWTFPVVSYRSANALGKKLALFSAALMVEQIMRIEAEHK